jgi:hypothetical protein
MPQLGSASHLPRGRSCLKRCCTHVASEVRVVSLMQMGRDRGTIENSRTLGGFPVGPSMGCWAEGTEPNATFCHSNAFAFLNFFY